jgi:hypothetical protein
LSIKFPLQCLATSSQHKMDKEPSHEIKIKEKTEKVDKKQNKSDNSFLLFYNFNGIKKANGRECERIKMCLVLLLKWQFDKKRRHFSGKCLE